MPAELVRRLRHPRTTIRGRLAVLYGGVFLASGVALLAVTYLLVDNLLPQPPGSPYSYKQLAGSGVPAGIRLLFLSQRNSGLHQFLIGSSIALAIMTVASVALGWLLAGRVLWPLRTITNTTRGISENNLQQRLALPGPRDELKELGDTIDELLTRLEAAFNAQKNFVANASHELRTPLTLARATLQVALADPALTLDSLRSACEEAIDTGRQQEELIDALLTLARSQRGLDHRQPADIAVIATDVARTHESAAAALGIRLDVSARTAPVSGDAQLIERLVSNLVDNALHYNLTGGNVQVLADTEAGRARLKVTNTGPLVPPQQIAQLLQPFHRINTDRVAGERDGLGLGLSIVHAITTAHGAELNVRPGEAGGLDVEVRFQHAPAAGRNGKRLGGLPTSAVPSPAA
jgi:signal transduction histidine kinase